MAGFDPYHQWLGISPKDQPPNHYRLLGLDRFESDPEVIGNVADLCMGFVRTFRAGEHSGLSRQILDELAAARKCLLNAQTKANYDAALRAKLDGAGGDRAAPAVPIASFASGQECPLDMLGITTTSPARSRGRRRGRGERRVIGLGAVFAVIGAIAVVAMLTLGRRPKSDPPSTPTLSRQAEAMPRIKAGPQAGETRSPRLAPDGPNAPRPITATLLVLSVVGQVPKGPSRGTQLGAAYSVPTENGTHERVTPVQAPEATPQAEGVSTDNGQVAGSIRENSSLDTTSGNDNHWCRWHKHRHEIWTNGNANTVRFSSLDERNHEL